MFLDAQSNNLPTLEYVLYPKPSGLLCCLSTLKEIRENMNMKRSTENNGNIQDDQNIGSNMNGNGRITVNNGISSAVNVPIDLKEHKADCVPYVRSESKDGYQKEKGQKNSEIIENIENINTQKKSVNEKERTRENNGNERETIMALHDLTLAYTDYTKGKKTSDRSLLYGKYQNNFHFHFSDKCLDQLFSVSFSFFFLFFFSFFLFCLLSVKFCSLITICVLLYFFILLFSYS